MTRILTQDWQRYPEFGYRHRFYIQALTCGPAVYVRTLKCASTFFYRNLQQWGWQEIDFRDIRWQHQLVFGHVMEPIRRRHKAVAEFIHMSDTSQLLFQDKNFQQLIRRAPVLDAHSASLHDYYGELAWLIDWIPLSDDHEHNVKLTEKLLAHALGPTPCTWDRGHAHYGDRQKHDIEQKLRELWDEPDGDHREYVDFYLERDRLLYQSVVDKFDPAGNTWPHMSWLRERLRFQ